MTDGTPPTILLTGANGQIGGELQSALAGLGPVIAYERASLDLTDGDAIHRAVRAVRPGVIVNAAAYTQVDLAESEPEIAHQVNAIAPGLLAAEASELGAVLIHYSTDYVFDGAAATPYRESDRVNPLNVYGRTKADGDAAILASGATGYIFRVGWVYGGSGRNFLRTVQRLVGEGRPLRIVSDQTGTPSWSAAIARTTSDALARILAARAAHVAVPPPGVYHMAAPDWTTWADFARAIIDQSLSPGSRPEVQSIATDEYPTSAQRPRWSVMDSTHLHDVFGLRLPAWRDQLTECVRGSVVSAD